LSVTSPNLTITTLPGRRLHVSDSRACVGLVLSGMVIALVFGGIVRATVEIAGRMAGRANPTLSEPAAVALIALTLVALAVLRPLGSAGMREGRAAREAFGLPPDAPAMGAAASDPAWMLILVVVVGAVVALLLPGIVGALMSTLAGVVAYLVLVALCGRVSGTARVDAPRRVGAGGTDRRYLSTTDAGSEALFASSKAIAQ
jgi:hypothetical protein